MIKFIIFMIEMWREGGARVENITTLKGNVVNHWIRMGLGPFNTWES